MRKFVSKTVIALTIILLFNYCTKPVIHNLPPNTTFTPESREFFGCRVNGKDFTPKAVDSSLLGFCDYKSIYKGESGKVFRIKGVRNETGCLSYTVGFTLDSVQLEEGKSYYFGAKGQYKNYGTYSRMDDCADLPTEFYTQDGDFGIVTITKLDREKKVIMGTFDFMARDEMGNKFRISDGIFDRHYSE